MIIEIQGKLCIIVNRIDKSAFKIICNNKNYMLAFYNSGKFELAYCIYNLAGWCVKEFEAVLLEFDKSKYKQIQKHFNL